MSATTRAVPSRFVTRSITARPRRGAEVRQDVATVTRCQGSLERFAGAREHLRHRIHSRCCFPGACHLLHPHERRATRTTRCRECRAERGQHYSSSGAPMIELRWPLRCGAACPREIDLVRTDVVRRPGDEMPRVSASPPRVGIRNGPMRIGPLPRASACPPPGAIAVAVPGKAGPAP